MFDGLPSEGVTYDGARIAQAPRDPVMHRHGNDDLTPDAELFSRVVNVTNRRYAELAFYNPFQQEQFLSGAPRTLSVGFRHTFTW